MLLSVQFYVPLSLHFFLRDADKPETNGEEEGNKDASNHKSNHVDGHGAEGTTARGLAIRCSRLVVP